MLCAVGRESGAHIPSSWCVFMRGVDAALTVELAQLSVAIWWVVFLFSIGVGYGDGRTRRVVVGLDWDLWGVRCGIKGLWRVGKG